MTTYVNFEIFLNFLQYFYLLYKICLTKDFSLFDNVNGDDISLKILNIK